MKRIRKPQWHRMEAYFDGPAKVVTEIGEAQVLLQGTIYEAEVPCPKCRTKVPLDKVKIRHEAPQRADLQAAIRSELSPHISSKEVGEVVDRIMAKVLGTAWSMLDLSPQLGVCVVPQESISNAQGEALRRMLEANLRQPVLILSDNINLVRLRPITQIEADRVLKEDEDHAEEEGRVVSIKSSHRAAKQVGGEGGGTSGGERPADDSGPPGAGGGPGGEPGPAEGEADQGGQGGGDGGTQPPAEAVERPQG